MLGRYNKFKHDSMKTVMYLVKEFEMKKSATAYKRANTSKTGIIDPMLLRNYKFSDDFDATLLHQSSEIKLLKLMSKTRESTTWPFFPIFPLTFWFIKTNMCPAFPEVIE